MIRVAALIGFAVLVPLSLATGIAKLVRLPAEMALFRAAGFSDTPTIAFGVLQTMGGLLLWPRSRRIGAGIMVATFCVASWVVWTGGTSAFFLVSLLFILLAALPFWPPFERAIRPRV
jgi:hypothetical protein